MTHFDTLVANALEFDVDAAELTPRKQGNIEKDRLLGPKILYAYHQDKPRLNVPFDPDGTDLLIEREFELGAPFGPQIINGWIDKVYIDADGRYTLSELKSNSRRTDVEFAADVGHQTTLYHWAISQMWGVPPDELAIEYTDLRCLPKDPEIAHIPVTRTPEQLSALWMDMADVVQMIEAEYFPRNNVMGPCAVYGGCDYFEPCMKGAEQ